MSDTLPRLHRVSLEWERQKHAVAHVVQIRIAAIDPQGNRSRWVQKEWHLSHEWHDVPARKS